MFASCRVPQVALAAPFKGLCACSISSVTYAPKRALSSGHDLSRHRIVATCVQGMTSRNASQCQPSPLHQSVPHNRLMCVFGAGWHKAASRRQGTGQAILVQPDQPQYDGLHHAPTAQLERSSRDSAQSPHWVGPPPGTAVEGVGPITRWARLRRSVAA